MYFLFKLGFLWDKINSMYIDLSLCEGIVCYSWFWLVYARTYVHCLTLNRVWQTLSHEFALAKNKDALLFEQFYKIQLQTYNSKLFNKIKCLCNNLFKKKNLWRIVNISVLFFVTSFIRLTMTHIVFVIETF